MCEPLTVHGQTEPASRANLASVGLTERESWWTERALHPVRPAHKQSILMTLYASVQAHSAWAKSVLSSYCFCDGQIYLPVALMMKLKGECLVHCPWATFQPDIENEIVLLMLLSGEQFSSTSPTKTMSNREYPMEPASPSHFWLQWFFCFGLLLVKCDCSCTYTNL